MPAAQLLLVDDDRHLLESMADWLKEQGYQVETAATRTAALSAIDKRVQTNKPFDMVLCDIRLGDGDGFDVLTAAKEKSPSSFVVMMTGYGSVESAVDAIRAGAFDFLTKPIIDQELEMAIERALRQRHVVEENKSLKQQLDHRFGMENIVGRDHRMGKVFEMIDAVADTKATILITGESGTGKSLIARAIHRRSGRRDKPFVEVACGALPENLLESELFGHVSGAFTGASTEKIGKFLQADGGTIFLDEIGTASPAMQVKLLRVLQEFEFEAVGGNKTHRIDTRVILATNEDLARNVTEGKFRQDLYYRINVINIELPALRERIADIPMLARHFLNEVCQELGRVPREIAADAQAALQRYSWPGNVRELQNVMERAMLLGKGETISVEDLPAELAQSAPPRIETIGDQPLKRALQSPERQIILQVLESNGWNRQLTADALGINRTTLYKKMKRLCLEESAHSASDSL